MTAPGHETRLGSLSCTGQLPPYKWNQREQRFPACPLLSSGTCNDAWCLAGFRDLWADKKMHLALAQCHTLPPLFCTHYLSKPPEKKKEHRYLTRQVKEQGPALGRTTKL